LKSLKSEDAVNIISKGLSRIISRPRADGKYFLHPGFSDPSALLKHELAYCLGQMKKTSALPALETVLRDSSEDPMVRHEVEFTFFYPS
jgi:deoxyhypusine monooxygenase